MILVKVVAFALAVLLLTACGAGTEGKVSQGVASAPWTVSGVVVDAVSRKPLGNIDVRIVAGDKIFKTKTRSQDDELLGRFSMEGIPLGNHKLYITADDYTTLEYNPILIKSEDNTPRSFFLGDIPLAKSFSANVTVRNSGNPIQGVSVIAVPLGVESNCTSRFNFVIDSVGENMGAVLLNSEYTELAFSNKDGKVSFSKLNRCQYYRFVALPIDRDSDGKFEFLKQDVAYQFGDDIEVEISVPSIEELTKELKVNVVANGTIVPNVEVELKNSEMVSDCGSEFKTEYYSYMDKSFTAVTNDEGVAAFSGVPICSRLSFSLLEYDSNEDGVIDFKLIDTLPMDISKVSEISIELMPVSHAELSDEKEKLNVLVTLEGEPVLNSLVTLKRNYSYSEDCGDWGGSGSLRKAFTNEQGIVVFENLKTCKSYLVQVDAKDLDDDGLYDTIPETIDYRIGQRDNNWISVTLDLINREQELQIVSTRTSLTKYAQFSTVNYWSGWSSGYNQYSGTSYNNVTAITAGEPIRIVFNRPVTLFESSKITLNYMDVLRNPDIDKNNVVDVDYGFTKVIDATANLDESGMILTVIPKDVLPTNHLLNITGSVKSLESDDSVYIKEQRYVSATGEANLSFDSLSIGLYSTNFNYPGTQYYVEFPEYVFGNVKILKQVDENGSVKNQNRFETTMSASGGSIAYRSIDDKINYILDEALNYWLSNTQSGDVITLFIDVEDLDGNTLNGEVELTVP